MKRQVVKNDMNCPITSDVFPNDAVYKREYRQVKSTGVLG